MTPLVMIRHGPTLWNEEKRLQGHTDIPLSDKGREIVSGWVVPSFFDQYRWMCSPLHRARETAELLGAKDLEIEPRLMEMNYGKWEGSRLDDLRKGLGEAMAENEARGLDFQPEGGETPREVQARLIPWLRMSPALTGRRWPCHIMACFARSIPWPPGGVWLVRRRKSSNAAPCIAFTSLTMES